MQENKPDFVDSKTRFKLQRAFKKAQKNAVKQYAPQIGEKAARRLVKLAARRLNQRGTENERSETIDRADISNTDTALTSSKGFQ